MKPLSITCNLDWLGLSRRVIFIWKENLGQAFRKFDIIFARASNFVLKGNLIYSACNYSKQMAESPKVTTENDLRISYIWSCKACVKVEWYKIGGFSWVTLAIVISYWPAKSGIKTTTNSHEDVAKGVKIFRISLGRHCAFRNQLKRRQSDFNHYTHFVGRLKLKCATNTNIRLYLIFVY